MKRILGLLVAVAALGGAAASVRSVDDDRLAAARLDAAASAKTARQQATDVLRLQLRGVEGRAAAAATVQPLVGILAQLRRVPLEGQLAKTLENWFGDEPHWKPFRDELPVYGLSAEGSRLGLLHGLETADLASDRLITDARGRGLASNILLAGKRLFVAAAARVTVAGLETTPVLLVARPLDQSALNEAADRAGGAVVLTDGKTILLRGGAPSEVDHIGASLGHEGDPQPVVDPDGSWAAAASPIGPGVWLWAHGRPPAGARGLGSSAATTKVIIWAAGVLIAVLSFAFGIRRPPAPAARVETQAIAGVPPVPVPVSPEAAEAASQPGYAATLYGPGAGPVSASRLMAATSFGRYTLVERLGEGGMAQVYTAVIFGAQGFRRKFVIKRMRPELVNDASVVAQFIDEANLASSLIHSNIVPVLDFGKVGDEYFLATEYILGRDLARVTRASLDKQRRPLPIEAVLKIAHETLKALEYAHGKTGEDGRPMGIVHRDVSPSNVLVSSHGEVKLFDFGIVKAEGRVTKTEHGVVKGNVSFMSPEQARGQATDARADLFSLGLVMFHCLTGQVLYAGTTTFELLVKAATGPGPEERQHIAALPAPAAEIVGRALAVDPNERFQTAGAFAAAIAPALSRAGGELGPLMDRLFKDDFIAEEKRFNAAVPSAGAHAAGEGAAPAANGRSP